LGRHSRKRRKTRATRGSGEEKDEEEQEEETENVAEQEVRRRGGEEIGGHRLDSVAGRSPALCKFLAPTAGNSVSAGSFVGIFR
jgi:hypothetical protein